MHPFHDTFDQWARQSEEAGDYDSHAIAVLARDSVVRGRPAKRAARVLRDVVEVYCGDKGALFVKHSALFDVGSRTGYGAAGLMIDEHAIEAALVFDPGANVVDVARAMVRQWEHDAEDARIARNNEEVPS